MLCSTTPLFTALLLIAWSLATCNAFYVGWQLPPPRSRRQASQFQLSTRSGPWSLPATALCYTTDTAAGANNDTAIILSPDEIKQDEDDDTEAEDEDGRQLGFDARGRALLNRPAGPYFALDRSTKTIEFGATIRLVTQLDNSDRDNDNDEENEQPPKAKHSNSSTVIDDWLRDEEDFATCIWPADLMQLREEGSSEENVYRIQLMALKFVSLQVAPWVDLRMKTVQQIIEDNDGEKQHQQRPVFTLQSEGFEPNVQLLPGVSVSAESLGLVIDVVGRVQGNEDNSAGLTGTISFSTRSTLPAFLRIVPLGALRLASNRINKTVSHFAVKSFQTGARRSYQKRLQKQAEHRQLQPSSQQQQPEQQQQEPKEPPLPEQEWAIWEDWD